MTPPFVLLKRRRDVYAHKGERREFYVEDWADANGEIFFRAGFNVIGSVAPRPSTASIMRRLHSLTQNERMA